VAAVLELMPQVVQQVVQVAEVKADHLAQVAQQVELILVAVLVVIQ
jgi:hypothetical protein